MKKSISFTIFFLLYFVSQAQEGGSVFQFLNLPVSTHAAALGGENISIIDDDLTLAIHNPALLSCVSDKTLNLNYMNYIDGVNVASAAFSRRAGERSAWAIAAQYSEYGDFKETNSEDVELGTFSAKDMALMGMYNYDLTDYWSGGVTTKLIYSTYEKYSSFAIGVDLGLNYYDQTSDFSASLVAKNLGGQIVKFDNVHENLPVNVIIGFSKKLSHAPFRLSVTMQDLTDWNSSAIYSAQNKEESFGKILANHFILGLDFLPTNNFYVSMGYNLKRADEMKVAGSSG